MIPNPIPGGGSEHQIKIKDKEKLVGRGLGYFQFMTRGPRDVRLPFARTCTGCPLRSASLPRNQTLTVDQCQEPPFHEPFLFIFFLHKAVRFLTETSKSDI